MQLSYFALTDFISQIQMIQCFADPSGNPVTQSVISVTDSSGNSVTG